ncbi:MAG TPA: Yip1 family protein [Casimicrobiaceae bacterium]|nr:Yip1 family protein [Casimicrobiaceae bacterium]
MNLVERVKNILLQPKSEWPKIAEEPATPQSLYLGYVAILAAIGPLAILIRSGGMAIVAAAVQYMIALVVTFLLALLVDALATTFGGEKNFVQSLKLTAYSYTAAWLAGIFLIVPVLGGIVGLLAAIYAWYTFYLGVPVLKKCPQDKAVGYTVVVVICGILLGVVLAGFIVSMIIGGGMMGMSTMGMFR